MKEPIFEATPALMLEMAGTLDGHAKILASCVDEVKGAVERSIGVTDAVALLAPKSIRASIDATMTSAVRTARGAEKILEELHKVVLGGSTLTAEARAVLAEYMAATDRLVAVAEEAAAVADAIEGMTLQGDI